MFHRRPQRSMERRPGTATAEFALISPVLVLLALGTVDFGRFAKASISVKNATRNGAFYGSSSATASADTTGIRNAVLLDLQLLEGIKPSDVTVASSIQTDAESYQFVTVTASLPFSTLCGFPVATATLSETCQMRVRPG